MENSTTTVAARPPGLNNSLEDPGQNHSHSRSLNHHHDLHFFDSITVIVVSIIFICIVFAIVLLIVMLRWLKSTRKNGSCNEKNSTINHASSRFIAHSAIDFNCSPALGLIESCKGGKFLDSPSQNFDLDVFENGAAVKERCLSGGNLGLSTPNRYRGVQVLTYKELELATDNFSEANVIGHGGFGVVYRGVLADGTMAAIKRLHRDRKQGERAFRMEVDLLSRLHSPYLVQLLGYCADQQHRLLIFEFMPNGTLKQHLHHPKNQYQRLDWGTRLRIALDCAKALEFLHDHAIPTVIHRDFKCTNILLDRNFRAKVSDFGLAKIGSEKINGQILTRVLGTTGYLAPEYASTGKLTTKSDVYSYGVVLLQLLTGRVPVDTKRPPGEHVLVSWALPRLTNRDKVVEMVDPALEGQYSKKDLIQIAAIAAMCVQPEADYRPLMVDVVQSLVPLVKSYNSISCSGSSRFQHQTPSPRY